MDVRAYLDCKKFPFWINNDTWRGDDAFEGVDNHWSPPSMPINCSDEIVNGRNDLVNFMPFALDLESMREAWGSTVSFEIFSPAPASQAPRFELQDIDWDEVSVMFLSDTMTYGGTPFHEASLRKAASDGQSGPGAAAIPAEFLSLASSRQDRKSVV